MNPDQSSREQIEARLTALLLGELPPEEAELLRWSIAKDPELKKLHDQLKLTIGFVREAMKNPADAPVEKGTPLKMSAERRQTLLAHFKKDRPKPLVPPLRRKMSPLIPVLAIVAIIALLAAVLLPVLNTAKMKSSHMVGNLSALNDMRQIPASGEQWELKNGKRVTPAQAHAAPEYQATLQTPNPQRAPATTPPPLAQIVLPNTEQSQSESSQEESAQVVGYVNVSPGASWSSLSPAPTQVQSSTGLSEPALPSFDFVRGNSTPQQTKAETGLPVEMAPPASAAPSQLVGQNLSAISGSANTTSALVQRQIVESFSPAPSSPPPLTQEQIPPTTAGGNFMVSALPPNSLPVVEAPAPPPASAPTQAETKAGPIAVTGIPPSPSSMSTQLRETKIEPIATGENFGMSASAAPVVARQGLSDSFKEKAAKDRNNSYGGGGGGGVGGVGFGAGAIPSNVYANNTFGLSGQAGSGGTVSFGGAQNGFAGAVNNMRSAAPHLAPSDNFITTNAIAENQGAFYGFNNAARREVEGSEQSPLIAREQQNANGVVENNDKIVAVTPIPGSSALPEEAVNAPAKLALPPPQQSRGQIQYQLANADSNEAQAVLKSTFVSTFANQAGEPSTPPQKNPADNEMIPPGLIDFQGVDVSQALEVYAQLTGRTLLRSDVPQAQIVLKNETPLTRSEAIQTLQRALALHGVAVVDVGDKFVKAVPASEAGAAAAQTDKPLPAPMIPAPVPQPEIQTRDNAFSTFSLNVSDVSFKLAAASLGNGQMPNPDSIRSEEFINAFDYHDPEPLQGQPLAFTSERARDPFAQERDLLRFSIKAAAMGRQEGRALNLVLLLDTSGSMERADRVAIIREALRVLSAQLQPQDTVSVVTFARTARLWADGVPGGQAGATLEKVGSITPDGGTNLEEAMRLAYETALRHFIAGGMNRVVLLTDGAANLGNVDPQALTQKVEAERRQGIALDCFGIGWEDYNDDLLEQLSSNGDGRYAFINSPDEAATEFAAKLAGALQVAAEDVKVQVEFNPDRVTAWRQIGYAKHQLTKEQFRDNSVAAGAIASREAGNALYVIETRPDGEGPIATVRVRYRVPGTQDNRERSWLVDYTGTAPALAQSSPAMRLAASAAEFSEWLSDSPYAQDVTSDELLNYLSGIPQVSGATGAPNQLLWMIRQAKSVSGK